MSQLSNSQPSVFKRVVLAAALTGAVVSALAPQDAAAGGFRMGGSGGRGGGGAVHASFSGGRGFGGGGDRGLGGAHFQGVRHGLGRRNDGPKPISVLIPGSLRHPVPPTRVGVPFHPWPFHPRPVHPWPIFYPSRHRWPVLPPQIIVRERLPIVPVVVGGGTIPSVRPLAASIPVSPACRSDGSMVSIVFVPTVTAADITAFLKAYNVTMADGPNADGIYRIRLSTGALPQNDVLKVIESMRSQTAIVSSVDAA